MVQVLERRKILLFCVVPEHLVWHLNRDQTYTTSETTKDRQEKRQRNAWNGQNKSGHHQTTNNHFSRIHILLDKHQG
jgi:hypothetical protein